MFKSNNVPQKLQPVIERWNRQGKEYYLGPQNMFFYNQHKITYHGGEDISTEGWFACNGEDITESYLLAKSDVEELQHELLQYYQTNRWTLHLDWHCNYQCPMCPYHGDGVIGKENYFVDRNEQMQVVPKEEAYRRIDELSRYGIKILSIMSQGEILLYPYWREVSEYARDKGMKLWTITNGSLWNEDTVKEAVSLGYTDIRVSLDALTFETYAEIRSSKRAYYENAMRLPELLMKHGITTNVHFVKQKENLHEVEAFLEYWKEKKVDSISIANEFCFDEGVTVNKFAKSDKEYIGGLCTAFGNMLTLVNGSIVYCCGMESLLEGDHQLETGSCQMAINKAVESMRDADSDLRKLCRNCSLYVPYSDESIVDGWKVTRTYERETWTRIK